MVWQAGKHMYFVTPFGHGGSCEVVGMLGKDPKYPAREVVYLVRTIPEQRLYAVYADELTDSDPFAQGDCDGSGPHSTGPTGGDGNVLLCRACFTREIQWRRQRNIGLEDWARFELPAWDSLTTYEEC